MRALLGRWWRGNDCEHFRSFFLELGYRRFESQRQNFIHGIDEVEFHGALQIFGQISQVLLIVLGQDGFEDSCTMRREQLLF